MKKLVLILVLISFFVFSGCSGSSKTANTSETSNTTSSSSTNANADGSSKADSKDVDTSYLDYINKIEIGDSLEKINETIGFKGKILSGKSTYQWSFDRGGISATFKDDNTKCISISLNYENEDVVNDKVVIKDLKSLKAKVSKGISYDDFKEILGGVDGILVSKNSITKGYVWRSPNRSVVNASFALDDNMCNNFVGTEK